MSQWTHPICDACWNERWPERPAAKMGNPEPERCCWCGGSTVDGIYLREDPVALARHTEHEDD